MRKHYRDYLLGIFIVLSPFIVAFFYQNYVDQTQNIFQSASDGNLKRYKHLIENSSEEIPQTAINKSFNNALRHGRSEIIEYVLKNKVLKNVDKQKSLKFALKSQDVKTLSLILDLGIEKKIVSYDLFSTMKNYYSPKTRSKSSDLIDLLVSHGADVNISGMKGTTLLNRAIFYYDYDAFNAFLRHGADVNKKGEEGNTPAHIAIRKVDKKYLKILIKKGADLTIENDEGNKPIHLCYRNKQCPEILDVLLENKQSLNVPNFKGQNLLHLSSKHENAQTIEKLMAIGFDIDKQDKNGNTPLHHAAKWKIYDDSLGRDLHPDALEKLLEFNPDATILNYENKTPLDIAKETEEDQTVQLLSEYMNSKNPHPKNP